MAVYDNPNTYEQQNDESLNRLFNKVRSLREVTVNIHEDADQQRGLIGETSNTFDQLGASLTFTAKQFAHKVTNYAGSHRVTTGIVGSLVVLWALWFFFF
ncbi:Uncharacterized protein MSYG_3939 [Malassezia sympodialis ATCC 42132]|uniref:t-SNARE coiled-coil homology domain-containing protein n=1 Tax=Malassezia sympodialis (strain ATCC 42132) TaxID=1230383 RepID=A0A1M8AAX7_MALS4|nr:Uncharacterized protein MSYG_3939 [Malassezia sympodialis ATCC 42132]